MLDGFCRTIDYIRISVTDRCNLRCRYCMPPEGITCLPMHEILSYEETIHLCRIFAELGVRKVKITGGEPFVRRNVCHLIRAIKDIPGIDSVTITTNGILALQHLKELKAIGIDGIIMTKMDGDSRGGAALSAKKVTGRPVKFVGTGEKFDALEPFHPERMASRILGMGDVLSLIEKAEQNFDRQKALELQEKLRKNKFTLTDFYEQMAQLKNMGSLSEIAGMLPGVKASDLEGASMDESLLGRMEAIILSMTPYERENPNVLNSSRKRRIAAGSGTQVVDINRLLKQFEMMQAMTKQFAGGKMPKSMRRLMGKKGGKGMLGGKMPGLPF